MGTYSPAEIVSDAMLSRIDREIVRPSVDAITDEGIEFRGTLFIGIMLTPAGPQVLEYNTRFGDPETQVVLPRIRNDLLELLWMAACGSLRGVTLEVRPEAAICVVVAARGYPGAYARHEPLELPRDLPAGVSILHAGTSRNAAGQIVSNGGRVLGVTALAPTLAAAAARAYATCESIKYASKYFRRDIGARQLTRS
jgi:phosphoribosylamine--glycine ligase